MEEIKYTRLRLGHTKFTHKHILLQEPQPECDACFCPVTVKHVISECPKYEIKRIQIFGNREIEMSDILKRGNKQNISNILRFLKTTGLFSEI